MKDLISMTDFVLSDKVKFTLEYSDAYKMIRSYAQFLKQPLTLGMFVPTDEYGNMLEEPLNYSDYLLSNVDFGNINRVHSNEWFLDCDQYQQAKERCIFNNVSLQHAKWLVDTYAYIDDITSIQRSMTPLELTPYALKQIGL